MKQCVKIRNYFSTNIYNKQFFWSDLVKETNIFTISITKQNMAIFIANQDNVIFIGL